MTGEALTPDVTPAPAAVCNWQRSEDGNDDTECGGTWVLNDGTPSENGMKFCPYCGYELRWHDYVEEPDDSELPF